MERERKEQFILIYSIIKVKVASVA